MATGFGGDARLALLSGVAGGINKRREEQRNAQRQAILNRLAETQIDQMKANVELRREQDRREVEQAQQETQEEQARLQAVAEVLRRRNPELSPEEALELAGQISPTAMNALAFGEDLQQPNQPRPLNALEAERARQLRGENDLSDEIERLRNHNVGLRLRRALLSPQYESEMVGVREMARQAGFSEEAIDGALLEMQPKDAAGAPKLTQGQKTQMRLEAAAEVQAMIQEFGGPEASLRLLKEVGFEEGEEDYYSMLVSELERIIKGEGGDTGAALAPEGAEAQNQDAASRARSQRRRR